MMIRVKQRLEPAFHCPKESSPIVVQSSNTWYTILVGLYFKNMMKKNRVWDRRWWLIADQQCCSSVYCFKMLSDVIAFVASGSARVRRENWNESKKRKTLAMQASDVIDCKTVRIFAYSSMDEQSNKRSGMFFFSRITRPTGVRGSHASRA